MTSCPACGFAIEGSPRFCPDCGAALTSRSGVAGEERKVVTALFCDLVGFTATSESADPEDVDHMLNAYFAMARHIIDRQVARMTATQGPLVAVLNAFSQGASTRAAVSRMSGLSDDVVDAAVDHLLRIGRLSVLPLASGCSAAGCGGCPVAVAGKGCSIRTV